MAAPFNSLDFIEDAGDILDKGGFEYIIFVGTHPDQTGILARMSPDTVQMFIRWAENGRLAEMIRNQFEDESPGR